MAPVRRRCPRQSVELCSLEGVGLLRRSSRAARARPRRRRELPTATARRSRRAGDGTAGDAAGGSARRSALAASVTPSRLPGTESSETRSITASRRSSVRYTRIPSASQAVGRVASKPAAARSRAHSPVRSVGTTTRSHAASWPFTAHDPLLEREDLAEVELEQPSSGRPGRAGTRGRRARRRGSRSDGNRSHRHRGADHRGNGYGPGPT